MSLHVPGVRQVDLTPETADAFQGRTFVGAVIQTHKNQWLLQQRPDHWRTFPGFLATFGGKIEAGETPDQALIRELDEELGASLQPKDATYLATVTEAVSHHQDLIHLYFWHDQHNSITGCYECEPAYFDALSSIKAHPKAMQDIIWAIHESMRLGLV